MKNVACVILAAGKGKRMKSDLPKVLHLLGDKPLLEYVIESCRKVEVKRIIVVVGFKGDQVAEVGKPYGVEVVWQKEQLGTGHAVAQTEPLLTAKVENPAGYGRVVRTDQGLVERVVEEADADERIRRIHEINSGMFCFTPAYLFRALQKVDNRNQQGEYYLPDVLPLLRSQSYPIAAQKVKDPSEILGVNSLEQLKQIAKLQVKH